jgi:ABC-2 type transport system permease protein
MSVVRLLLVSTWLQVKMRSRSAFDGVLGLIYPLFFSTTVFLMFRQGGESEALVGAAVGASVMGVWSAVSTTASTSLQQERRQGTLELLVASPTPFPLIVVPITISMAFVGLWSLVATLLWGRWVFGIDVHIDDPAGFIAASLVTVFAIALVGYLLAVTAVRYRGAWALGTAFELPVWLICGFLVPIAQLPDWVRPISWALPPTWGVAAVKDAAVGSSPWVDIVVCLAVALCYAFIATAVSARMLLSARANATLALT